MSTTKDIPISAAKDIAKKYCYTQIVIIGRSSEREHVTTYGISKEHCSIAAKVGNFIKYELMKWDKRKNNN